MSKCQSKSVKLTLALYKEMMTFDSFFKERVVLLEIVSKGNKIIINNNIYNIKIYYILLLTI